MANLTPRSLVAFERIESAPVSLTFARNQTQIETRQAVVLDRFGAVLQGFTGLRVEIATSTDRREQENVAKEREHAIAVYLADKWKVESERVELKTTDVQK